MKLQRLSAALFAVLFFGGLPLFWLSTLEGPTRVVCGGSPWRCEVSRWVFFQTKTTVSEPARVDVEHRRRGKGNGFTEWRLVFTSASGAVEPATDWGGEGNDQLATTLEAARLRGADVTVQRPAEPIFWVAVALTVLFVAVGLFIVLGTPSPASISRGRPE